MTTSVPNGLVNKIRVPSFDVLGYVDRLARQLSLSTAASDSDIGSFVSGTMSSRNAKLFVVGFIPPDNPINFVPFNTTSTPVGGANTSNPVTTAPQAQPGQAVTTKVSVPGTGDGGSQAKVQTNVSAGDLRQALFNGYVNATGQQPSEATLGLIYSQCVAENAGSVNPNNIGFFNYNFGNTHATGGQQVAFFTDNDPKSGDAPGYVPPKTGTYYVGIDSTKGLNNDGTPRPGSRAFRVAFNSFNSLQDGANYQVAVLLRGWPGTSNAQTVDEFVDSTKPIAGPRPTAANPDATGRAGYFGLDPAEYAKGMQSRLDGYNQRFPDPLGTGPQAGNPSTQNTTPSITTTDGTTPSVMSPNVSSDPESDDPLGSRLGRNIQVANVDQQALVASETSALQAQVNLIASTPPLVMMINPSEFTREYEYQSDDSATSRQGHIVHVWLERPMSISCTGTTAAQYVMDANGNGGLTSLNRIQSIAYRNLLSLVMTYKNNGLLFTGDEVPGSKGVPILSMSIFIYYDDHIYIGSFDDFSVEDDAEKPFNLSYSYKFNVRYDIELDGVNAVTDIATAMTLPGFNAGSGSTTGPFSGFNGPGSNVNFG